MELQKSRALADKLQNEINAFCKKLAQDNGIQFRKTRATYGADEIRVAATFVIDAVEKAKQTEVYGFTTGLKIGDRFGFQSITYTVESFNRAGNIIALRTDGRRLIFRDRSPEKKFAFLTRIAPGSERIDDSPKGAL